MRSRWLPILTAQDAPAHGEFRLQLTGVEGKSWTLQSSANLTTWTSLETNQLTGGVWRFADPFVAEAPQRFYRAQLAP